MACVPMSAQPILVLGAEILRPRCPQYAILEVLRRLCGSLKRRFKKSIAVPEIRLSAHKCLDQRRHKEVCGTK